MTKREYKGITITDVDVHTAHEGGEGWPLTRHFMPTLANIFPWWSKEPKEHPKDALEVRMIYVKTRSGKFQSF